MADDPLALEAEMRAIAAQIKDAQRQLAELGPSDLDKISPKQREISQLTEKYEQKQERWKKALKEYEG